MKGFVYTIVLSLVLVLSIVILRSLSPQREKIATRGRPAPKTPMVVQSDPAVRSNIDPAELEKTNLDALYQTGLELLDLWHVPEAIDVFETLVELDPTRYKAFLRLVECYSHPTIGAEKQAASSYERARVAARAHGGDSLWVSAFHSLFVDPSPKDAIDRFNRAVKGGGEGVDNRLFLAMAFLMDGRPQDAERYLADLLDGDESLGRARELMVYCEVAKGDYDQAESLAKDLASIYPEEPYPYVLLSRVELIRGEVDEAVDFSNNALRLDDRYVPAIVARAHLYVAEGDNEAARVSFEKLLLFDDAMLSSVGMEGIAYVNFLDGRFDEASDALDESVRLAMSAESTRRGLVNAFRHVNYLCELGRTDAAETVLERWVSRRGDIPYQLGRIRIGISAGRLEEVRHALDEIEDKTEWRTWMRALGLDFVDFRALAFIEEKNFNGALDLLNAAGVQDPGTRRIYLKGFALFHNGNAEEASGLFRQARLRFHGIVFPYHGDPVLYAQGIFFLAEAALARGESDEARQYYGSFLDLWGECDWELQAVARAREKLEALSVDSHKG
ncbi:MAG: tetratricopeptide repeat protein [Candidatus Krumholzibacteriia bacterium]